MIQLGQKVKALRGSIGMTQERLAEKSHVSLATIDALESGQRRYVTAMEVEQLAGALDVPSDELWRQIPGGKLDARFIALLPSDAIETFDTA